MMEATILSNTAGYHSDHSMLLVDINFTQLASKFIDILFTQPPTRTIINTNKKYEYYKKLAQRIKSLKLNRELLYLASIYTSEWTPDLQRQANVINNILTNCMAFETGF